MREKDDSARGKILEAAKAEFLERGFAEASMRTIAERAGFTTGMLYSRFADKSEIFRELVDGPADKLYNYFMTVQNEFAGYSPEYQRREMHPYVAQKIDRMVDLIYDNFDAFKLILCKSGGTSYEYYVDKMIDVETESTFRFIDAVRGAGFQIADIRKDLAHMLASAMFNGMFEVVMHDLSREDARQYILKLQEFFNAGWDKLLGL
ncbi:MAG TPA: TetR/AcrR family transcriptional regulator [Candidatus Ornithoclostridium faecigallinarum]|nr:TetR/AcrR family transcriptional regulator [Candidatus Ornithoclostridium faecigallinarum]